MDLAAANAKLRADNDSLRATIAERERAVASLRQSLTFFQPEYENVKRERDAALEALEEAQGKLDILEAASGRYWDGYSHSKEFMDTIYAILRGTKEDSND